MWKPPDPTTHLAELPGRFRSQILGGQMEVEMRGQGAANSRWGTETQAGLRLTWLLSVHTPSKA